MSTDESSYGRSPVERSSAVKANSPLMSVGLLDVAAQQRHAVAMLADRPEHLAAAAPDVEDDRAVGDASLRRTRP